MSSNQLLQDELTGFCRSHALSFDGLQAIFEGHGVVPIDNDTNISYEFFHEACLNKKITECILRYLLEYFPNAVRYADGYICDEEEKIGGCTPLHSICFNKNVTLGMVQLLIDAFPDSLRHEGESGCMPLHYLCGNKDLNDEVGLKILKLLLERHPGAVRHAAREMKTNIDGILPIHFAAGRQSPEFCRILVEAYPGSEQMVAGDGMLPFHAACVCNTVATAEYLYQLCPESIDVACSIGPIHGFYPIHVAISRVLEDRRNPASAVEMTQFLLHCNPNVALQEFMGKVPFIFLHYYICGNTDEINENPSRLNQCLKMLQLLYDAHPDVIEDNHVTSNNVGESCAEIQTFIDTQLAYARQARDRPLMTTPDENWQLPLHRAFRDNAAITLGSIKLLVKGNSSAVRCPDNRRMIPLHVACQHHESASVVEHLINLDPTSLRAIDFEHNTALHHACCGANYEIIALLTEKYGALSASKQNAHGQIPIDLLFASREVSDREGVEYMESIYRLLRAYPAMMNCIPNTTTTSHLDSKVSGKKRKIDNAEEEGEGYYSYLSSVKRKLIRTFWGR
jgi:ankyrin repeat protein